ncbi:hypothetical protein ACHAW5_009399 [Stephanodiscus triporus]|uniref:Endonuclease/exonuclease/phosphatase domain-containing protein n=1 Tax=Stephanodiscus triporus TaxID=2934178 RepID=A0ABD3PLJ7_9STRA
MAVHLHFVLLLFLPVDLDALTITTFNILAPVHRSMNSLNHRESERDDWWRPRAMGVADYISRRFADSDVVLLQEWWFDDEFAAIFDSVVGDAFVRVAERRPGPGRDDGMCCLVRKTGKLELVTSTSVSTGPQRIAQIVHCRERRRSGSSDCDEPPRDVFVANAHLSYPGDPDPNVNGRRQANEATIILDALARARDGWGGEDGTNDCWLEAICGDFNSDSTGAAATVVESRGFVNGASAAAEQALAGGVGGRVNVGVTHRDHLGNRVSVDHVFLRSADRRGGGRGGNASFRDDDGASVPSPSPPPSAAALALGFLDARGTRILGVRRGDIHLDGRAVLSDHRPVTARIAWPGRTDGSKGREVLSSDIYINATMPLDPLEPAWGMITG